MLYRFTLVLHLKPWFLHRQMVHVLQYLNRKLQLPPPVDFSPTYYISFSKKEWKMSFFYSSNQICGGSPSLEGMLCECHSQWKKWNSFWLRSKINKFWPQPCKWPIHSGPWYHQIFGTAEKIKTPAWSPWSQTTALL